MPYPIIEIKGEKTTGEWHLQVAATHDSINRALWAAGKYENEYVKESGEMLMPCHDEHQTVRVDKCLILFSMLG